MHGGPSLPVHSRWLRQKPTRGCCPRTKFTHKWPATYTLCPDQRWHVPMQPSSCHGPQPDYVLRDASRPHSGTLDLQLRHHPLVVPHMAVHHPADCHSDRVSRSAAHVPNTMHTAILVVRPSAWLRAKRPQPPTKWHYGPPALTYSCCCSPHGCPLSRRLPLRQGVQINGDMSPYNQPRGKTLSLTTCYEIPANHTVVLWTFISDIILLLFLIWLSIIQQTATQTECPDLRCHVPILVARPPAWLPAMRPRPPTQWYSTLGLQLGPPPLVPPHMAVHHPAYSV